MHRYLLRINCTLFQRIKVEAESRGLSINDMINEIIEIGLLNILKAELNCKKISDRNI